MSVRRWLLVLTAFAAALPRFAGATSAENGMFASATRELRSQLFEQAERDFGQFIQQFPESARLPEAILAQAEARFKQANYNGALELLISRQSQAGKWADEFLFWMGECYSHKGEQTKAAETFARLAKDYPRSSRLLEATVNEAAARSRLEPPDWAQVILSLQQTNGVFQSAARTNAASDWVARGYLLLGEAFLAQTNYHVAEAVLAPLGNRLMNPALAWQWQYVVCRAQLGDGRVEAALLSTSNLLMLAKSAEQPGLVAQSISFKAHVLEQAGRADQAIDVYKENLIPASPIDYQQRALLKIAEISVAQSKIPEATQTLEKYLAAYPNASAADLGWLTLGELRLREFANSLSREAAVPTATNGLSPTNYLQQARQAFETLTTRFPKSSRVGMGYLHLGWCLFFLEGKLPESQKALQASVEHLSLSPDLARAYFKLADTQFRQQNFAAAASNYRAVVEKFAAFPEVKTNLFEPALYQTVQAALAAGDLPAATNALQKILEWYPDGFHTERAALVTGQEITRAGDPSRARAILSDFAAKATNSLLLPEVKLAIARTYEQQGGWTNAIQQYDLWLATFTNNPARPRAEFCRALDYARSGNETSSWTAFTNFVALYPTNDLTPQAQWWLADFNFRIGDFNGAERDFQRLYSKWPASELACEARMMAGLAAVARQSWENAKDYFAKLYDQTNCPVEIRLKALAVYGDYWISRESTNKALDYAEAVKTFARIVQECPTNEIGLLALGRKGDVLMLSGQFDEAAKAYQQITNSLAADFATRAEAIIGLAGVLERQADQKNATNRTELLKQALDRCLDVLFPEKMLRDGEKADPFWTKEAGMTAIRLAELLQDWPRVVAICKELCHVMPVLCPKLEKKVAKAQENLRAKG